MIRLFNRRFVTFYYDMTPEGVAHDPAAVEALTALNAEELDIQATLNPSSLLIAPDGKLLGEFHGYLHPDAAVEQLRDLLREHPEYNQPSEEERATKDPIGRAKILIDLMEFEVAKELLAGVDSDEAHYLLGHIARLEGDVPAMVANLSGMAAYPANLDARVEYAWRHWHERKYEELAKELADFPAGHARSSEAQYLIGLSLYHRGEREAAREQWAKMIQGCSLSPWVYRADWAYYCTTYELSVHEGGDRGMKPFETFTPLNRHGYGYRGHPDLRRGVKAPFDEHIDASMEGPVKPPKKSGE